MRAHAERSAARLETRQVELLIDELHQRVEHLNSLVQREELSNALPGPEQLLRMLRPLDATLQELSSQIQAHEQEREQLRALRDVTAVINSSLELDDVLSAVMDVIVDLTGAERSFLLLIDEETGNLEVRAACDLEGELTLESAFDLSYSTITDAVHRGEPILTMDAMSDSRFIGEVSDGHGMRSILCVPLKTKGAVTGVIYTDNRQEAGVFDESERDMLVAFANQAAVAIENAHLFEKIRARERRLQQRVHELTIEIDAVRKEHEVAEITGTDYFQSLEQQAEQIRQSLRADPIVPSPPSSKAD